jgi:hypothetical protein
VLKDTECRYCFEYGHTTKFCPVLADRKKDVARREHAEKRQEEKKKEVKREKPKSGFAVLADSSDSEDEKKPVAKVAAKPVAKSVAKSVAKEVSFKEEFPALSAVLPTGAKPVTIGGWASVAAKSAEEFQNEKYAEQLRVNSIKRMMPPIAHPTVRKNWADWSDSDDEEDEYEEVYQTAYQAVTKKASEMDFEDDEDW